MILRVFSILFLIISIILTVFLYRLGIFTQPEYKNQVTLPERWAVIYHYQVPYYKSIYLLQELVNKFKREQIKPLKCFAEYFDDQNQVEQDKLKFNIGCEIDSKNNKNENIIRVDQEEYIKPYLTEIKLLEEQKFYLFISQSSPAIAGIKVYPFMKNQLKNEMNNHIIEYYHFLIDNQNQIIEYYVPINHE